jgi:gamma-glutamyl phosphate reductase
LFPSHDLEGLERTLDTLGKARGGKQAIRNLQASVVLRALNDSLQATSNKSGGTQLVSPNAFIKSLNKFEDKLDLIFKNNPQGLKELRELKLTARDLVGPESTTPRGSASFVKAVLDRLNVGRLPGIRGIVQIAKETSDVRFARRALKTTPEKRQAIEYVSRDFPALAAAMAIPLVVGENDDNE